MTYFSMAQSQIRAKMLRRLCCSCLTSGEGISPLKTGIQNPGFYLGFHINHYKYKIMSAVSKS